MAAAEHGDTVTDMDVAWRLKAGDVDVGRDGGGAGGMGTDRRADPRSWRGALVAGILACAAVMAVPAVTIPAAAQTSIEVIVNNKPITSYDVDQRARLLRLVGAGGSRKAAEDELIHEVLQLEEARRVGIEVTMDEIDAALRRIAQGANLTTAQLEAVFRQNGIGMATFRERLRAQIAWAKLVQARFRGGGGLSEQDIVAALRDRGEASAVETVEYDLRQVSLALPTNASAARRTEVQRRAQRLRERFTSCEQGTELVKEVGEVVIQPFGKRLASDLPPAVQDALEGVEVGRLSRPIPQQGSLIMLAVCGKETIKSSSAAMAAVENEMVDERTEQFAKQYLRSLRRDAVIERR